MDGPVGPAFRRAVKSRKGVYSLLDAVAFDDVLRSETPISVDDFEKWHEAQTLALCARPPAVPVGWAVKIINVYLKTAVYVGQLGGEELRAAIHPPIDAGLKKGLRTRFPNQLPLLKQICRVRRIKDITEYKTYRDIIDGCKELAKVANCSLIEVEQFWLGSATPVVPTPPGVE